MIMAAILFLMTIQKLDSFQNTCNKLILYIKQSSLVTIKKPDTYVHYVFEWLSRYHLRLGHLWTIREPDKSVFRMVTVFFEW
jgi:hypothetical protein